MRRAMTPGHQRWAECGSIVLLRCHLRARLSADPRRRTKAPLSGAFACSGSAPCTSAAEAPPSIDAPRSGTERIRPDIPIMRWTAACVRAAGTATVADLRRRGSGFYGCRRGPRAGDSRVDACDSRPTPPRSLLDPARGGRPIPSASTVGSSRRSRPRAITAAATTSTTRRSSRSWTAFRHTIELAPSPDADLRARGVVATGPVGSRLLGRWRVFRYEVRCWPGGRIPDLACAVGGARRVATERSVAQRVLGLVSLAPVPVWGRDELHAGEMWNSNSMISWVLATAGVVTTALGPPRHGRAPGWNAGLVVARRSDHASAQATPWSAAPAP